jgi:hypothetical protein
MLECRRAKIGIGSESESETRIEDLLGDLSGAKLSCSNESKKMTYGPSHSTVLLDSIPRCFFMLLLTSFLCVAYERLANNPFAIRGSSSDEFFVD